jgi:hypothetical protein
VTGLRDFVQARALPPAGPATVSVPWLGDRMAARQAAEPA